MGSHHPTGAGEGTTEGCGVCVGGGEGGSRGGWEGGAKHLHGRRRVSQQADERLC